MEEEYIISLSDENEYFSLRESGAKIFDIELNNGHVTFFSKYPTAKGFFDDYPSSDSEE